MSVRVAMLSKWHVHADGYAREICQSSDAEIVAVWDEEPERGAGWAKGLGVDFEEDLDALLARQDIDAVIVCTPTSEHCRVMVAAAKAGKHIFTEKAMAPTLAECKTISAAVAESRVKFCISHPQLTSGMIQYAKKAIDDGAFGRVHYLRIRTAHAGSLMGWLPAYWYDVEKAAGGAMMDLGCHPMYTAAYLLGRPRRVASIYNTTVCPPPADDHAVSVVEFENRAIAVLETSFISPWSAETFEILGTEGAMYKVGSDLQVRSKTYGVDGWIRPDKLPDARPCAMRMWLDGMINGSPIPFDTKRGEILTELLENAYISDAEQRIVAFENQ